MKNLNKILLALLLVGISVNADLQAMKRRADGQPTEVGRRKTARSTADNAATEARQMKDASTQTGEEPVADAAMPDAAPQSLVDLPYIDVALGVISSHLDLNSLIKLGLTCKRFRNIVAGILSNDQNRPDIQQIMQQVGYKTHSTNHHEKLLQDNLDRLPIQGDIELEHKLRIINFLQLATNGNFVQDKLFLERLNNAYIKKIKVKINYIVNFDYNHADLCKKHDYFNYILLLLLNNCFTSELMDYLIKSLNKNNLLKDFVNQMNSPLKSHSILYTHHISQNFLDTYSKGKYIPTLFLKKLENKQQPSTNILQRIISRLNPFAVK